MNALTIDVEEWFQVSTFDSIINIDDWVNYQSRIYEETLKLLTILNEYNTKATFFVLGYVAERHPELVKKITNMGHEVATHGYSHRLVCKLSPDEFAVELLASKNIIEQITGQRVIGYRAPSYSVTDDVQWIFDILGKHGIEYDSSVLPGDIRFGISNAERFPYNISKDGRLIEFPPSTISLFGKPIPFSGGLFLRIFPYPFIKYLIKKINDSAIPVMVYFHPWELDIEHPRLNVTFKKRFIHYHNLTSTEGKLRALLSDFSFGTVRKVLGLNYEQK